MIPAQSGAKVERGKNSEHRQRNDLLNHLELNRREAAISEPIGGNLKAILKEGDAPADEDDLPQRLLPKLQMPIPGNRHKDIGEDEKNDGPHSECLDAAWRSVEFAGVQ